jgi:D-lyxose ketol-isomerase
VKRSEIEAIIEKSLAFMTSQGFHLPSFAGWSPVQWRENAAATTGLRANGMGWNIVEFEEGAFFKSGIAVFTLRMGDYRDLPKGAGRLYGEKAFVLFEGQSVPHHYHRVKTEDLINRGGGILGVNLVKVDAKGERLPDAITLERNGIEITVPANTTLHLDPGESIVLVPRVAHAFLGVSEVLCGEISLANDDSVDNYFLQPLPTPSPIIEDVPARHVVLADYRSF